MHHHRPAAVVTIIHTILQLYCEEIIVSIRLVIVDIMMPCHRALTAPYKKKQARTMVVVTNLLPTHALRVN